MGQKTDTHRFTQHVTHIVKQSFVKERLLTSKGKGRSYVNF